MVYVLLSIPPLRNRRHLYHLFRLCCLCLTESSSGRPSIRFQGATFSDPRCRLAPLLLPAQSYVANSVGSAATCTPDEAMEKYRVLRNRFGSGNGSGDPWIHVDSFGRSDIFKKLSAACQSLCQSVDDQPLTRPAPSSLSTVEERTVLPKPGKSKKRAYFGDIPHEEVSKAVKELREGSSKD